MQVFYAGSRGFANVVTNIIAFGIIDSRQLFEGMAKQSVHLSRFFGGKLSWVFDMSERKKQQMPGIVWIKVGAGSYGLIFPDGKIGYGRVVVNDRADNTFYCRTFEARYIGAFVRYEQLLSKGHFSPCDVF
jgi:hypothetical protein